MPRSCRGRLVQTGRVNKYNCPGQRVQLFRNKRTHVLTTSITIALLSLKADYEISLTPLQPNTNILYTTNIVSTLCSVVNAKICDLFWTSRFWVNLCLVCVCMDKFSRLWHCLKPAQIRTVIRFHVVYVLFYNDKTITRSKIALVLKKLKTS